MFVLGRHEYYARSRQGSIRRRPPVVSPPDCFRLHVVSAAVGQIPSGQDAQVVTFKQSADKVEGFRLLEVTASVARPTAQNPFTDVTFAGQFQREGDVPIPVHGFCDSADGGAYRIRFMPSKPGKYSYTTTFRQGETSQTHTGTFEATDGKRRGVLRVDKDHPWHFVWEGTGEHYFFNGNTAFLLMGWQDEAIIRACLDRQQRLKVNRLRVLLGGGRSSSFWGEPIIPSKEFQVCLNPWVARQPNDITTPKFDYTRFNYPLAEVRACGYAGSWSDIRSCSTERLTRPPSQGSVKTSGASSRPTAVGLRECHMGPRRRHQQLPQSEWSRPGALTPGPYHHSPRIILWITAPGPNPEWFGHSFKWSASA